MRSYLDNVGQSVHAAVADLTPKIRRDLQAFVRSHNQEFQTHVLRSIGAYQSLAQLEEDYHRQIVDVSRRLDSLEEGYTHLSRVYLRPESWRNTECVWPRPSKRGNIVHWQFSSYSFPIGFLTIGRISRNTDLHGGTPDKESISESSELEFTYLPPQWIANTVVKALLKLESFNGRTPRLSYSLSYLSYNPSHVLCDYLHEGNISGLQTLFANGEARPTDILAPSGRSLLHVSTI